MEKLVKSLFGVAEENNVSLNEARNMMYVCMEEKQSGLAGCEIDFGDSFGIDGADIDKAYDFAAENYKTLAKAYKQGEEVFSGQFID